MVVSTELPPRLSEEGIDRSKWYGFVDKIGRPPICERLSLQTPWTYFSMEVYETEKYGLKGGGGLGILAGDTILQAEKEGMPFTAVTPFYPQRLRQELEGFWQVDKYDNLHPSDFGYTLENCVLIYTNNHETPVQVWKNGSVIVLYEPGLKELYHEDGNSEHRLYQQVIEGFAGMKALEIEEIVPEVIHLNESASVFASICYLDILCKTGFDFHQALEITKAKTLLTNHTLVPAANCTFSRDNFENYVFKNLDSDEVKDWLIGLIEQKGGRISLETIALEIAGVYNGVSQFHAEIASRLFKNLNGRTINFQPITNGIFTDKWIHTELLEFYRQEKLFDEDDLPYEDFEFRLLNLDIASLVSIEAQARDILTGYLTTRQDQYGNSICLPKEAILACWARRLAGYKRPGMTLENPDKLADILDRFNIYCLISGKTHPTDIPMKMELNRILTVIDQHPVLKKRVRFIQDYDDKLARSLLQGVDIWINTPVRGQEACGTSWLMALANRKIVISTCDGGVADFKNPPVLEIRGNTTAEELASLYKNLNLAARIAKDPYARKLQGDRQLKFFLPTVSGARMLGQYLKII